MTPPISCEQPPQQGSDKFYSTPLKHMHCVSMQTSSLLNVCDSAAFLFLFLYLFLKFICCLSLHVVL